MKKTIVLVFVFLVAYSSLQGQLLWQVTGKNQVKPSYLFGTHHLIPIQFLDSVPGLFKAFNRCDIVISEMHLNQENDMRKLQKVSILPDNITLMDILDEEDYNLVDQELRAVLNLGLKEMGMLNPEIISTMYVTELYRKSVGLTGDVQSDSYFQSVASFQGKQVIGLENVDQQIAILLGNKSLEEQAKDLVESVQTKEEVLKQTLTLDSLYRKGNIEALMKLSLEEMTPGEYYLLVDKRNSDWMEQLSAYIDKSPCFIAVGALHLGGDDGLIALLKAAGYKVKAVKDEKVIK